jgi:hypothetical protein
LCTAQDRFPISTLAELARRDAQQTGAFPANEDRQAFAGLVTGGGHALGVDVQSINPVRDVLEKGQGSILAKRDLALVPGGRALSPSGLSTGNVTHGGGREGRRPGRQEPSTAE